MIIKRYIVDNMNEAMTRIRYELGNDAVIVSQRKIRQKGILGFLRPKKIEVTAAVDDKKQKESTVKTNELEKEIKELKNLIENLNNQSIKKTNKQSEVNKNKFKRNLINSGVPEEIATEIIDSIKEKIKAKK